MARIALGTSIYLGLNYLDNSKLSRLVRRVKSLQILKILFAILKFFAYIFKCKAQIPGQNEIYRISLEE